MIICLNFKNLHKEIVCEKFGSEEIKNVKSFETKDRQMDTFTDKWTKDTVYSLIKKNPHFSLQLQQIIKRIVPKTCTYRSNRPGDHHICYIFDKLLGIRRQWSLNSKLVLLWRDRNHRVCQLPTERAPVLPFIDSQVPGHFLCL